LSQKLPSFCDQTRRAGGPKSGPKKIQILGRFSPNFDLFAPTSEDRMTEGLKPTSGCFFDPIFKRKSLQIDPNFVEKWA